jgi:peptidoglycan-associated lipoprotein
MRGLIKPRNLVGLATVLALASTLTGCSYVKQQEFDDQLASVRAELQREMAAGDQGVSEALGGRIDGVEARLAALESALQALESEFDATVDRLETAIRFNMPVYFAFDDDQLRSQDRPVLDRFAEVANEYYPGTLVTVEGFTDSSGSQAYNLRLGMRRAEAVKTYLVSAGGMNPNMMKAVSYGEEAPRQVVEGARGPGESGWENRRVVLVIDHGGTPPAGGS